MPQTWFKPGPPDDEHPWPWRLRASNKTEPIFPYQEAPDIAARTVAGDGGSAKTPATTAGDDTALAHTNAAVRIALDLIHHRGAMTHQQREDAFQTAHDHLDRSQELAGERRPGSVDEELAVLREEKEGSE